MDAFLGLLVVAAIIGWYIYSKTQSYGDSDWVRERIQGRNENQVLAIRFFCNDPGCLNKVVTIQEYDDMLSSVLNSYNFKQMALNKISIDEDELKEIEPVHFEGYVFDKNCFSRLCADGKWRSSKYQVSWLFFNSSQVFLYQYTLNTDEDGKSERTEEYFYKDITSFSTSSDTVETSVFDIATGQNIIENVESNRFAITVPGDKFYCSMEQSDNTERVIQGMKSLLRDKKNSQS